MAPRSRSRKVGLKRIDAAIDALGQLGFSKGQVVKTISRLLKVYGGDEGWTFIEEGAYQVVIEKILEDEEEKRKQNDSTCSDADMAAALELCRLSGAVNNNDDSWNATSEDIHPSSAHTMVLNDHASSSKAMVPYDHASSSKALVVDSHVSTPMSEPEEIIYERLQLVPKQSGQQGTPLPLENVPGPSDHSSTSLYPREPCYGWISESESEDEEDTEPERDWGTDDDAVRIGKHKSRWDETPY